MSQAMPRRPDGTTMRALLPMEMHSLLRSTVPFHSKFGLLKKCLHEKRRGPADEGAERGCGAREWSERMERGNGARGRSEAGAMCCEMKQWRESLG